MTVKLQENLNDKCYQCQKPKCDDCEVLGEWSNIITKNVKVETKVEKKTLNSVVRLDHTIADKIDNLVLGHNYVHTRLDEYLEFLEDYCTTKCETIDKRACETCDINVYRTKALDSLEDLIEEKKEE